MGFSRAYIQSRLDAATEAYDRALESIQWSASGRTVRRSDQLDLYRKQVTYWQRELDRATGKDQGRVSVKPGLLA